MAKKLKRIKQNHSIFLNVICIFDDANIERMSHPTMGNYTIGRSIFIRTDERRLLKETQSNQITSNI